MPNGHDYTKEPSTYKEALLQVNMKLENIETDVGEMRSVLVNFMEKCDSRFHALESGQTERKTKIEGIEKDIEDLYEKHDKVDAKVNGWGGINSIVAFIAGIIGWFK